MFTNIPSLNLNHILQSINPNLKKKGKSENQKEESCFLLHFKGNDNSKCGNLF